jgi:dipeptidyl-peptidase-4
MPGTGQPLAYESFQWARDSRHILFLTDFRPIYRNSGISDFFLFDRETNTVRVAADDARTAELSPDGRLVGFERGGDLYVVEAGSGQERRLTTSGSDTIFNGVFDWVYEEEFGLTQAWQWSPDSRRIAYWQTDERGVPAVRLTDYEGQHPDWVESPYPKVGDENPEVRIGVVDVASGETRWMDTGISEEHYVPRIYWTSDPSLLAVTTLNRAQNHFQVFLFDVETGERTKVLDETSDAWIDVYDFFAGILDFLTFPEGVREFFWISDRTGHQHLYRYDYEGKLLGQVTQGDWSVTRVEAIDPERRMVYYTSTEVSPLERHLYAVSFDGSGKRKITEARGTHAVDVSPDGRWFIDRWSNTETPQQVEVWSTEGRRLAVLTDNARVVQFTQQNAYSPKELFEFTNSDGVTLDGSMIRPPDFDPAQRYPVLVSIYGGPGSQQVYDDFANNGWEQYLAQQGYVVVGLNNRGSGNYGRDFMEGVYRQLGALEAEDFAEVGRWLAQQPWVDGERMAIFGTSYGGYSTLYTMFKHPGVFALGIANSPVTDWRLYDTIYTERYMGLLDANEAGYQGSSVIASVEGLQGRLLLIHSAMDENVHPQNTMQLLTALASAGKDAELRFYPPGGHGAAFDLNSFVTMTEVYTNALCRELKTDCQLLDLNR